MSRRSSRWRGHRSIRAQVCELADHGLLGEGLLPTLREVFASGTASKDATIIRVAPTSRSALFERRRADGVEDVARVHTNGGARTTTAGSGAGAALRARRRGWVTRKAAHALRAGAGSELLEPAGARRASGEKVDLQVQKRGRVDAVGYRWRMDLGFGESVSNEEDAGGLPGPLVADGPTFGRALRHRPRRALFAEGDAYGHRH